MHEVLKKHGQKILEQVGTDCRKEIILEPEKTYLITTDDQGLENIGLGKEVGNEGKDQISCLCTRG